MSNRIDLNNSETKLSLTHEDLKQIFEDMGLVLEDPDQKFQLEFLPHRFRGGKVVTDFFGEADLLGIAYRLAEINITNLNENPETPDIPPIGGLMPKICSSSDCLSNQERCVLTGEWTPAFQYYKFVRGDSVRETQRKAFLSSNDETSANSLTLDIVIDYVRNGFKGVAPTTVTDSGWESTQYINDKSVGIIFPYYDAVSHSLPTWVYIKDNQGISDPWLLNKPDIFFVDSNPVVPGELCRIFGRNLTSLNALVSKSLSFNDNKGRIKGYIISKTADLTIKSNYKEVQVLDSVSGDAQSHFFEEGYNVGRFVVPAGTVDGDYYFFWYILEGDTTGVCHTSFTVSSAVSNTFVKRISPILNYDNLEVDHSSLIQTAIIEALAKTKAVSGTKFDKAVVLLAPGDYYIGSVLVIPQNVELMGSGRDVTRIRIKDTWSKTPKHSYVYGTGNINLFKGLFSAEQPDTFIRMTEYAGISDICLESSSENFGPKYCLYLRKLFESSVKNVNIKNNKFIHPKATIFNGSESLVLCESVIERMIFENNHCISNMMFDHTFGDSHKIRCLYKGNLFQTQRMRNSFSGVMSVLGTQCIFENNTIDGLYRGIFSTKNDGAKYQNVIMNNQHLNGSQFIEGSESLCHEDYDEAYSGPVTMVDSLNFIIPNVKWYFNVPLFVNGFKSALAIITKGKGFGQIRRITQSTLNPVQITIDKPWVIEPDETSSVSISQAFYQNFISNWHTANNKGGIQLVKAIDNTMLYCSFYNCAEGVLIGATISRNSSTSDYNTWQWGGSWHNKVKFCKFVNSNIFLYSTREYDSVSSPENVLGIFATSIYGCFIVNTPVSMIDRVCEGFNTIKFDDPANAAKIAVINSNRPSMEGNSLTMNKFDCIMMPWTFFTQASERTPNYDLISVSPHGIGSVFCSDVQATPNKIFSCGVSINAPIRVLTRYLGQF